MSRKPIGRVCFVAVLMGSSIMSSGCFHDLFFPQIYFDVLTELRLEDDYHGVSTFTDPGRSYTGDWVSGGFDGGTSISATSDLSGHSVHYDKRTPAIWTFENTDGDCQGMVTFSEWVVNKGTVRLVCRIDTGFQGSQYTPTQLAGLYETVDGDPTDPLNDLGSNFFGPNETMYPGDIILDDSGGDYSLVFQRDGNLALWYLGVQVVWATGTSGTGNTMIMQSDGNLVIYNSLNDAIWSTGTQGNNGAYLNVQSDGNLSVYSATDVPLWAR
jgi:hypothetical protein